MARITDEDRVKNDLASSVDFKEMDTICRYFRAKNSTNQVSINSNLTSIIVARSGSFYGRNSPSSTHLLATCETDRNVTVANEIVTGIYLFIYNIPL